MLFHLIVLEFSFFRPVTSCDTSSICLFFFAPFLVTDWLIVYPSSRNSHQWIHHQPCLNTGNDLEELDADLLHLPSVMRSQRQIKRSCVIKTVVNSFSFDRLIIAAPMQTPFAGVKALHFRMPDHPARPPPLDCTVTAQRFNVASLSNTNNVWSHVPVDKGWTLMPLCAINRTASYGIHHSRSRSHWLDHMTRF